MAIYWLSFRIHQDSTADKRRDALVEAVWKHTIEEEWWLDTTSFIVFKSNHSIEAIGAAAKAVIAPARDLFLMRQMGTRDAIICGKRDSEKIFDLMVDDKGNSYLVDIT